MAEIMSKEMVKIWQSILSTSYEGKEADVLAALIAMLFAHGVITREDVDSLREIIDK